MTEFERHWPNFAINLQKCVAAVLASRVLCAGSSRPSAAQALETESARLLRAGTCEFGTAFEFQTSKQGTERVVRLAIEYGLTNRLSLLVEPVAYTLIRPKHGPHATNAGDLGVTGFYVLRGERGRSPAVAAATEVKVPTAKDPLITTGQADFTGCLIASRRVGRLDLHANVGYTIFGQPSGVQLNNIFNVALAGEYHLSEQVMLFGEMLGNTASSPEGGGDNPANPTAVIPEAAGGELVGPASASRQ